MTTQKDEENFSDYFDKDIKLSPNYLNNAEEQNFLNNNEEDEYSRTSFLLSDKSRPLFISNENFINYFMHIDYNTPLNQESIKELKSNINISNDKQTIKEEFKTQTNSGISPKIINSQNELQNIGKNANPLKKSKKEKEYGILTDSKTGITYNEEEDPINYKKAKKRIQNRESALRMKKLRESGHNKLEEELSHLREDNIRLINENVSLKKEKEFLIEQIKFMQKIIKESNLEFKLKNDNYDSTDNNSNSSNEDKIKEPILYYDGSKQKIKGKLFNVSVICTLALIYIIGECSLSGDKINDSHNSGIRNEPSIHLNSIKENEPIKYSIWFYLSKIILIVIFLLMIPLFKELGKIVSLFKARNKRNNYICKYY